MQYVVTLILLLVCSWAYAGNTDEQKPYESEKLVIVASKTLRPLNDVVGSVTLFDEKDISQVQAADFDDLFRLNPSISMNSSTGRFQSSSISIRGIGGNRVAIEVDGVPSNDQFELGSYAHSSRFLPEINLVKQVEVLNGPASTLYGSNAIGGVVTVSTWEPKDLTGKTAGNDYYQTKLGYDGKNQAQVASGLAAFQLGEFGALVSVTKRKGGELNNDELADYPTDKIDWEKTSFFSKFTFEPNTFDKFTLTINTQQENADSFNNSLLALSRFKNTAMVKGDDSVDTYRINLSYKFASGLEWFADNALNVYYQDSKTVQKTDERRTSFGIPVRQLREFKYHQEIWGVKYFTTTEFAVNSITHNVASGLDLSLTKTKERRDASQINLNNGSTTKTLLSETFPLRDFPLSKTEQYGVFVQDEISFNSQWQLIPALRFDYYRLSSKSDGLYLQNNPNLETVDISETALSPKLGLLKHLNNETSAYLQYVHGFRAPPYEDANIGLYIPMFKIRALPNPNLKSEESNGLEVGMRHQSQLNDYEITGFYTRYRDFIETRVPVGVDTQGVSLFQSRNITSAEIYGLEFSFRSDLSQLSNHLQNWHFAGHMSLSRGKNRETHQPLNSISPAQAVLELGWTSLAGDWDMTILSTISAAKTRVDETSARLFQPSGYAVTDFLLRYNFTNNSSINIGIFNLFNKKYWRWEDVRTLASDEQLVESVVRPERHISLKVSISW